MSAWRDRRLRLGDRQGWWCHYCLGDLQLDDSTLDHIVPLAWGGNSANRNLVLACRPCNGNRGHRLLLCGCRRCVDGRLWVYLHGPRRFRQLVDGMRVDLCAGEQLRGTPVEPLRAA